MNDSVSNTKNSKKRIFVLIASIFFIAAIITAIIVVIAHIPPSPEKIYKSAASAVVEIHVETKNGEVIGTGFFYNDEGAIITNHHVIAPYDALNAYVYLHNGKKYEVDYILGCEENSDLAIIVINYKSENILKWRETPLKTGETVYAIGSSVGLSSSFSEGIVSNEAREISGQRLIQITTPISHGNSGGPLIDKNGEVVGITSAGIDNAQNLNFAIPIAEVRKVDTVNGLSWFPCRHCNTSVKAALEERKNRKEK